MQNSLPAKDIRSVTPRRREASDGVKQRIFRRGRIFSVRKCAETKIMSIFAVPKRQFLQDEGAGLCCAETEVAGKGEMPEWSIGPHSKCGVRVTVPGVRIPLSPLKKLNGTVQFLQTHVCRNCFLSGAADAADRAAYKNACVSGIKRRCRLRSIRPRGPQPAEKSIVRCGPPQGEASARRLKEPESQAEGKNK